MIRLRPRRTEADDAVEIACLAGAKGHAEEQVAVIPARGRFEARKEGRLDLVEKPRCGGFRKDDEPAAALLDEVRVGLERACIAARIELQVLRNVSLQQACGQRGSGRFRPRDTAERDAGSAHPHEYGRGDPAAVSDGHAPQQAGARERGKREQVDAADRCEPCERRIDRGVPGGEPRKTGQDPAAQPFNQRPQRRNHQRGAQRRSCRDSSLQRADERREECKESAQAERRKRGERSRHPAEAIHADVHPRDAGAEQAEAKPESCERGGTCRRGALP